jgi:site-specific recombinase
VLSYSRWLVPDGGRETADIFWLQDRDKTYEKMLKLVNDFGFGIMLKLVNDFGFVIFLALGVRHLPPPTADCIAMSVGSSRQR